MKLCLTSNGRIALEQPDDLTSLKVVAAADAPLDPLSTLGEVEADHVWLDIERLAAMSPDRSLAWRGRFDAMLDFAASRGWVRDGCVRAHVERV